MSSPENKTSLVPIVVAWLIVTIPLGWGVYQSVVKSLPLFHVSVLSQPEHAPAKP